ncbi:adenosine/AMP kinase [Methylobacterium sp. RAS18]|nr:adenosine/AMP kinase [Methylobacterium sp. RAS18]
MADRIPYRLTVEHTDDGPRLVGVLDGERAAEFDMDRDGARTIASALLAATGDAFERTFTTEAARG